MNKSREADIKETDEEIRTKKEVIFRSILNSLTFKNFNPEPTYGKLVRSGRIMGKEYCFDNTVGYIVQVRKKAGSYKSDQYLIRHSDGTLTPHENQTFSEVSGDLYHEAMALFVHTPEEEIEDNPEMEYFVDGECEKGFIIEPKNNRESNDHGSFIITTVTESN